MLYLTIYLGLRRMLEMRFQESGVTSSVLRKKKLAGKSLKTQSQTTYENDYKPQKLEREYVVKQTKTNWHGYGKK